MFKLSANDVRSEKIDGGKEENTYNNMTTVLEFQIFTYLHFYFLKKILCFRRFQLV